jgi:hypothetical protein
MLGIPQPRRWLGGAAGGGFMHIHDDLETCATSGRRKLCPVARWWVNESRPDIRTLPSGTAHKDWGGTYRYSLTDC